MFDLEAFAHKETRTESALATPPYLLGYRSPVSKTVVVQIEIPAEVVERAVLSELLVVPRVTPDGKVTVDLHGQTDLSGDDQLKVAGAPIYELVARAMARENLRLEDANFSDLHTLLRLLEQSLSEVRSAIAVSDEETI
jgi:hypothetical protein